MALKELKIKNLMRGRGEEEIIIRFDPDDLINLSCHCEYDPALCKKNNNEVSLIKKIEIKKDDGSWDPYPSVTWLDGVETDSQLATRAFVCVAEGRFDIICSADGDPDGELIFAAKKAGVYTEFLA